MLADIHEMHLLAVKGFWSGFTQSLYKRSDTISAECITPESQRKFREAILLLKDDKDTQGDYFTVLSDLSYVISNLAECDFRKAFRDIQAFCG